MVPEEGPLPFREEVTEVSVLLRGEQVQGLEQAAHARGLTLAQMLRRLIGEFLQGDQRRGLGFSTDALRQWA
jgi:hypothetical protein